MEYTFKNKLKTIYEWNKEFINKNNILMEDIFKNIDNPEDTYIEDVTLYIHEKLINLSKIDYKEFNNLVCLITLELYNIMNESEIDLNEDLDEINETEEKCDYEENEYDEEENDDYDEDEYDEEDDEAFYEEQQKLIEKIEECDKESFIASIKKEENDDLFNMIYTILDYHEYSLYEELDYRFYGYENMNAVLKTDNGKCVYKHFHPDLNSELKNLYTYLKKKKIIDSLDKLEITSLFKYIYSMLVYKQLILEEKDLACEFHNKLEEVKYNNKELYDEILYFLISYFYMSIDKKYTEGKKLDDFEKEMLKTLRKEELSKVITQPKTYFLIKEFINFDFIEYDELVKTSSEPVKKVVKKLTNKN